MTWIENDLKVLDDYENTISSDSYRNIKEKALEELLEDDDNIESAEEQFKNRREESRHQNKIRTTLMVAFLRNGIIERATNWEFKKLFPLRTHEVPSADVLIGNQTDGSIILIIILPLRKRPETGIEDAIDMLAGVRDNNSTLSGDIDLDFRNDRIQTAVAIEPSRANDTATAIEEYERSVSGPEELLLK